MKEACEATITANKLVCSRPSWPARHDAEAYLVRPRPSTSIGLSPKIAAAIFDFIELFATQPMAILLTDHAVRGGA